MPNLRGSEFLIILLLVVLLFGAKRLPDAARGIGRSLRIFKAETKGLIDDEDGSDGVPDRHKTPEQRQIEASRREQATGSPDDSVVHPRPDADR